MNYLSIIGEIQVPLDGLILNFLYFLLLLLKLQLFVRHDLFFVLFYCFHSIVVRYDHLSRNLFNYFPLLILNDCLFYRYSLYNFSLLIIDNFSLIGYIFYSASIFHIKYSILLRYYNGARSLLPVFNCIRGVGESGLCRSAETKIGVGERAVKTGVGDCERFI